MAQISPILFVVLQSSFDKIVRGAKPADTLNREINAGLANPTIRTRLADLGATMLAGSPVDLSKLIAEDNEKWAKVIRAANIKPE
jgi:tripartite-type tricarboxylate transporter receptor subunit TctC